MPGNPYTKISFYVVAHADDWQLFMCPNVYNDVITSSNKNVFIITTAGDAGKDEKYCKAREEGCKSSLRFCFAPVRKFFESDGVKYYNGHKIFYWYADDAICYFLRLPDGNLDGSGFSANNFQSLSKLKSGAINYITAVDHSTSYNSWKDFYTTLEAIIETESSNILHRTINYLNPDASANPDDHADHTATGEAIQCINAVATLRKVLFNGYNSANVSNLNNADFFWKAGMFAAYEKAVFDNCGYSTLKENINDYIGWCSSSAQSIIIKPAQ